MDQWQTTCLWRPIQPPEILTMARGESFEDWLPRHKEYRKLEGLAAATARTERDDAKRYCYANASTEANRLYDLNGESVAKANAILRPGDVSFALARNSPEKVRSGVVAAEVSLSAHQRAACRGVVVLSRRACRERAMPSGIGVSMKGSPRPNLRISVVLEKYMERLGISQTELARKAGCSQAAISRLTTGARTRPSSRLLVGVSDALRISLDELLGRLPRRTSPTATVQDDERVRLLADSLRRLRSDADGLATLGIRHASVFGSLVNGSLRSDSDIDVLVDVAPHRRLSLLNLGAIQQRLSALLGREVDLAIRNSLHPSLRDRILKEEVVAF